MGLAWKGTWLTVDVPFVIRFSKPKYRPSQIWWSSHDRDLNHTSSPYVLHSPCWKFSSYGKPSLIPLNCLYSSLPHTFVRSLQELLHLFAAAAFPPHCHGQQVPGLCRLLSIHVCLQPVCISLVLLRRDHAQEQGWLMYAKRDSSAGATHPAMRKPLDGLLPFNPLPPQTWQNPCSLGLVLYFSSHSFSFLFIFCFLKEKLFSSEQNHTLPGSSIYAWNRLRQQ